MTAASYFDEAVFIMNLRIAILVTMWLSPISSLYSADVDLDAAIKCSSCEYWNQPQTPFKIHGHTYYVGTTGLSSVLIASDKGLILLQQSCPCQVSVPFHVEVI